MRAAVANFMGVGIGERTHHSPSGWRRVRLSEVCLINPRRPAALSRDADAPTTFVPMSAVDERLGTIAKPELRRFAELQRGYTYFQRGDILFAKITPCMQNGKHAIARELTDDIGFASTEFHVIRPESEVLPEWIHYFIRQPSTLAAAERSFTGTAGQQRVPPEFLGSIEIPLPPLQEQKRIVALLNEQMAVVERARLAAEAQTNAACALARAFVRTVFEGPQARRWPRVHLGEVLLDVRNGVYKPEHFYGSGTRILKMFNIGRLDGTWSLFRVDRLLLERREEALYSLQAGDILMNRVNSRELVGKCAVVDHLVAGSVFESKNMRLRLKPNAAFPTYVAAFVNSSYGREQIEERTRQIVGQATINRTDLNSIKIPLPPLEEQQRLADWLGGRFAHTATLCRTIEEQSAAINALSAALSRRAFNGEL